ncbi:hypothetical protein L208DRAFT_1309751, partial [Tricholoma matsutake]
TYYESIQWHPPNPYHSIHCMCSIDHIIWYIVAYLSGLRNNERTWISQKMLPTPPAQAVALVHGLLSSSFIACWM